MKNMELRLIFAGLFLCAAVIPAFALGKSKEELKLEAGAAELDISAGRSGGEVRVAGKIKALFGVDGARVLGLHYKKLGYGDIAIVLGLAQDMPGGLKDENLYKVVALRQGPPAAGWGKIAGDLGLKLGPAAVKVKNVVAEVHRLEKISKAKKDKKAASEKAKKN